MVQESPLSADGELDEYEYEWLSDPLPDGILYNSTNNGANPFSKAGGQVLVPAGTRANVRGFPWSAGDTPAAVNPDLTGASRTDLLVLRLDRPAGHQVGLAIVKGVPGAGAPAVTTSYEPAGLLELPICEYDVANGAIGAMRRRCWLINGDGVYLADSALSEPGHGIGRRMYRTDLKRLYVSNGAKWQLIADDSGQLPITLVNGWAFTSKYLRRVNGLVVAQLSLQRTGGALGSTRIKVAELHSSCRPDVRFESGLYVTAASNGSGRYPAFVEYRDNGDVFFDLNVGIAKSGYAVGSSVTFAPAA
ncbi:hypothetical protein AB0N38_33065 [Micromonospora aurantiaca]|uniref:hypothetical protein n=1 Tax=Micromonospora aurantiaca (nom. illeg.) TaxID=47850 RepID=UPI0034168139